MKIIYLNVKCQRIDEEHPDNWQNIEELGLSVAATYNTATKRQTFYQEKANERQQIQPVGKLINQLVSADLVVTFNGHDFDFRILNAYSSDNLFKNTKSFNILENVEGDLWQRLSLMNLAKQNLYKYHTTTVKHQIELYQRNLIWQLKKCS